MGERRRIPRYAGLRPELMDLLACPACRSALEVVEVFEGNFHAVREGWLACRGCEMRFSVTGGVPRLVLGTLQPLEQRTVASFGLQWQSFARRLPEWHERCRAYFEPHAPEKIGQGTVLDAGCGYGRWLALVAEGGGTCVAMDLSDAVFSAAAYLADRPNCHLVQGDVLNLEPSRGVRPTKRLRLAS